MARKLHELLAAEADLEKRAKMIVEEAKVTFNKKTNLFTGRKRTLEAITDEYADIERTFVPESQKLEETVPSKLEYVQEVIEEYWDAVYQKERTNQAASADVIIDDVVVVEKAPVTFLLGMEKKLKSIRDMFLQIPTLEPGVEWEPDENMGNGIFKLKEHQIQFKTKKEIVPKILYEATDKHPAQIEVLTEQKEVGRYKVMLWSGMITSREKANYLTRIDKLLIAVKEARMRANTQEVITEKTASKIFDYILG